jgi:hypothetical protein
MEALFEDQGLASLVEQGLSGMEAGQWTPGTGVLPEIVASMYYSEMISERCSRPTAVWIAEYGSILWFHFGHFYLRWVACYPPLSAGVAAALYFRLARIGKTVPGGATMNRLARLCQKRRT